MRLSLWHVHSVCGTWEANVAQTLLSVPELGRTDVAQTLLSVP